MSETQDSPEVKALKKELSRVQTLLASQAQAGFSWEKDGKRFMVHGDKESIEQVLLLVQEKARG